MKVLLVNGSPRRNGNTFRALSEVASALNGEGIETEIFQIGTKPVRGCAACCACVGKGKCVFDDDVCNELSAKFAGVDGIVVGSPTYYGQPNGALLALLQRACFSGRAGVQGKPAASVAVCRRGGSTAAFQCMNMPFEMLSSLIVGSQYWNVVFGRDEGEAALDTEGMQTMRTLARNMAWAVKNLRGDGVPPRPEQEPWQPMNFIR